MRVPVSADEAVRLSVLESLDLLDTPADEAFDRIVRFASHVLETPIALVSLVAAERQWFKSRQGLEVEETPREVAFCAHAIKEDGLLIIPDARRDPRFADNPLVLADPKIRFYAGAPLIASCGAKLGTLCVIDRSPRQLDDRQKQMLRDLGDIVMDQIELRRLASSDPVTGAFSRRHILELAEREARRSRRYGFPMSIAMLDIDDFKSINDRCGHAIGDAVLKALADCCHGTDREQDLFGRVGGDEFLMVMPHTDGDGAAEALERIRHTVEAGLIPLAGKTPVFTVSVGVCEMAAGEEGLQTAMERADLALYAAKEKGRNRVTRSRAA